MIYTPIATRVSLVEKFQPPLPDSESAKFDKFESANYRLSIEQRSTTYVL